MARHERLYARSDGRPVDWDNYVASYPDPWAPCYYQAGLDDAPGMAAAAEVISKDADDNYIRTWTFLVLAPRRPGRDAYAPNRLETTGVGLAIPE